MTTDFKKLEFEKDILDPHIVIGGKYIQIRMKREKLTLCERCLQFGYLKEYCRGNGELCKEPLRESGVHSCGEDFCLYCKETTKQETRKYVENT